MTRFEKLKEFDVVQMAGFIEGIVAILLGTTEFSNVQRRVKWLEGEDDTFVGVTMNTCESCRHYEKATERTGNCRHLGFANTYNFYCADWADR